MRMWKSVLAGAGLMLFASCGSEPTSIRAPEQPSLDHGGSFNVTIQGPGQVSKGSTCEWDAVVSGGTPPYTYLWMAWDNQIGYSANFVSSVDDIGAHALYVEVSDANFNWDSATIGVTGTSGWGGCGA